MSREVVGTTPAATAASELGERVGADALRFVRQFAVPIERVWAAVTTPAGVAAWLGRPVRLDLVADGAFEVALGDDEHMDGRIIEVDAPRRLIVEWHEWSNGASAPYGTLDSDKSVISFALTPDESGGTTLIFIHRYIHGGETMRSFGAGWHAHLDALDATLTDAPPIDLGARYAELKPRYDAGIAAQ